MEETLLRLAFDVDGVVLSTASRAPIYRAARRLASHRILGPVSEHLLHVMQDRARLLYVPPPNAVLITARPVKRAPSTFRVLHRYDIYNKVIFRPDESLEQEKRSTWLDAVASYKADTLKLYDIDVYFDDDEQLCDELSRRVPLCKIVYVGL